MGKKKMAMHSNWNPWHGCIKCSEGCKNCYVYYLDAMRGKNGADIYKTKIGFKYPLSKDRSGKYKIQSGEMISVCMTSDFFLQEANEVRVKRLLRTSDSEGRLICAALCKKCEECSFRILCNGCSNCGGCEE